MKKPASFLDRDGVINIEKGYVYDISDFEWIAGAKNTIKLLNDNNFYVFIVTNQSGISKGLYSEHDVIKLHKYINQELEMINAHIADLKSKKGDLFEGIEESIGSFPSPDLNGLTNIGKGLSVSPELLNIAINTADKKTD